MDSTGNIHTNTVVDTRQIDESDVLIGLLANEVPSSVKPAKILPENYIKYIGSGKRLPVCQFDYDEKGLIHELEGQLSSYVTTRKPLSVSRLGYFEYTVVGDSGDPVFLFIGDQAVLLGALHLGGVPITGTSFEGAGSPFITFFAAKVQSAMNELCAGYTLSYFDFTGYEKLSSMKAVNND